MHNASNSHFIQIFHNIQNNTVYVTHKLPDSTYPYIHRFTLIIYSVYKTHQFAMS